MFDRLFQDPRALARHQNGPLAEERRRFLAYCIQQQMSLLYVKKIAHFTLIVAKALRLAERPGELITQSEIEIKAAHWANRPKRRRRRNVDLACRTFTGNALRWLTFLGRVQPSVSAQRPYAEHVAQFSDYQLRERGLSPLTVVYYRRTIHRFLARIQEAGLCLQTLTIVQIDELLAHQIGQQEHARSTIHGRMMVLRAFFRFAEQRGWCPQGLAAGIMIPRLYSYEGLPLGLSWDDVQRLLAAAEGGQPVDIRDRALLLLLAVYGLRAGEVTALCLKDFAWEREILSVPHSKSQKPRTYPLCRLIGDAVLRYLREVRPQSDRRELFLTVLAPFRPLTANGLGEIVRRRLHALGLTLPHYGPHMLRHACATHLLAQGLSLKEVGDHLGHVDLDTTRIYAKVDLTALREVGDFPLEDLL
jgi:site-specific recombinase XerD